MAKVTVYSMHRGRAHADTQKRLGLKVGGTATTFSVSDGTRRWEIEVHGATPGERSSAARKAFLQEGDYHGPGVMAVVRRRHP